MRAPAVRFTVLSDECIRIEWSPTARFVDEPSLFAPLRPRPIRTIVSESAAGMPPVRLNTARATIDYRPDGRAPHAGNLAAQVRMRRVANGGESRTFWHPGDVSERNLGGTLETLDGLRGPAPIGPGLLSRDGWHLIDDSRGTLLIDGWAAARAWRGVPEGNIDWYLFVYGSEFDAALRALAHVSGPVPVPRRCALGSWYSRYWPHTSAEYRGIVADYHTHGFPLDVMVLDMDWHSASARGEWTGWSWNRDLLPDAEELLAWMHAQGLAVTLNLHPADGVGPREDRYESFMRAQGADPRTGERLAFDAGNRPYMQALFEQVLGPLEARERADVSEIAAPSSARPGVDFWWVDWQQDRFVPSVNGLTNLAWLNQQFYQHTARGGLRGLSFSRWAGLESGDHRHPIHFSGDAHTGWEMLAYQVPFTVAAGNAGCFFWSHDIGGHFGPRNEECTARWVWFGALSAALRLHSARTAALDRRPWTSAEPFAEAMRRAFALRSTLMPYIDGAAHECESHARPLLRPMYLCERGDERAFRAHGQYLLGSDLLAAPVVAPGVGPGLVSTSRVWFPINCGTADEPTSVDAWRHWFTHERFAAGAEAMVASGIDEVPLFAPEGVPIPTRGFSHRPASDPIDELVIRLWPGAAGTRHERALHEDDGRTTDYRRGRRRRTPITAEWREAGAGAVGLRLIVGPATGEFEGAAGSRDVVLALGGAKAIGQPRINGDSAVPIFDEASGTWRLRATGVAATQQMVIEATVQLRDPSEQSAHDGEVRARRAAGIGENCTGDVAHSRMAAMHMVGLWADTAAPGGVGRSDTVHVCDPLGVIDGGEVQIEVVDRIGPATGEVASMAQARVAVNPLQAGSMPLPRQPLSMPRHGLRAARIARAALAIRGEPHAIEIETESKSRPITEFLAIGPFAWDWRISIHDQQAGPEHVEFDPRATFEGLHGSRVGWTVTRGGDRWPVDLRLTLPGPRGMAYAATRIVSPRRQRSFLRLDCGDKVEAWLNGEKVFSQDGFDTPAAAAGGAEVELPMGESLLMIKTSDGGGGWGFAATLEGEAAVSIELPR